MAAEEVGGREGYYGFRVWNRAALIPCNNANSGCLIARLETDPSFIYARVHVDDLVSKSGYKIGVQEIESAN